jgi:hypothetical protein
MRVSDAEYKDPSEKKRKYRQKIDSRSENTKKSILQENFEFFSGETFAFFTLGGGKKVP